MRRLRSLRSLRPLRPLGFVLLAALILAGGCGRRADLPTAPSQGRAAFAGPAAGPSATAGAFPAEIARVVVVQDRHTAELMRIPGVVGTGTGLGAAGAPVVRVYTASPGVRGIPASLEGVPVDVEVTGPFEPFLLNRRYRPVPIGVSVSNNNECAAGTIGCVVVRGGSEYVLSNNHVLARVNAAALGEPVVQPGRYDNHPICEDRLGQDKIAELADFERLVFNPDTANVMDAAIAALTTTEFTCATLPDFYGLPGTTAAAGGIGLRVKKVGRTSGLSRGAIAAVNVTVDVGYGAGRVARFTGQYVTSRTFSRRGDSGSLVVTDDSANSPVALLFAGAHDGTTVVSPIGPILTRFDATICTH